MGAIIAATLGLVVCMILILVRALLGPTVYDRILAVNTFGTVTVMMIAVGGYLMGNAKWKGVLLRDFLAVVQPAPGARYLWFESTDVGGCHAWDLNLGGNYQIEIR